MMITLSTSTKLLPTGVSASWLAVLLACVLFLLTSARTQAQDPPQYGTPYSGVPNRMDANIYQMNLREYSSSRNIAGARANLQRIKDLGINVLYLMPIYPVSSASQASGSPYANSDYKSVAPDLGTLNDLRGLVEDAHNLGMAVILDFIVNQTGWDHPWVTQNPGWFLKDGSGNITSPCPAPDFCFGDVAGVDLNVAGAANAMIDAMRYWVFAANVDGFRFDWADQPPQAFWTNAINNLRSISTHDLLLLAEGSNEGTNSGCTTCGNNQPGAHYSQGFDYIFGTNFYWNVMKKVWNSGEPVLNLDGVTSGEYNGASSTQLVARFLSNHDDYNADGSPFSFLNGGRNAVMAAFVLATYHRSVPFVYNGIEVGNTNSLTYPWNSGTINWTQDLTVYTEMQQIINARNGSVALRRGLPVSYIDPANTNPNVFAFTKESSGEKVAILINPRGGNSSFTIPSGMSGAYNDIFTGASVTWTTGQNVILTPYQYIVLSNGNITPTPVTGVTVSPTSATINEGLTQQLTANVQPSTSTNKNVTWSSSNTSIATVSSTGLVTGQNPGTATITVTTQDGGFQASATVTVNPAPAFTVHFFKPASWGTGINIYWWAAQPSGVLADGSWPGVSMTSEGNNWYSHTFTNVTSTNLIFNDGTNQTADLSRNGTDGWYLEGTWYNSPPSVISVTGVSVSPTSASMAIAGTQQLSATISPSNATNQNVSWSSSNTSITTVSSSGLVTGVAGGTAIVTATTQDGGFTANATITVQSAPAAAIPGTIQAEDWTAMNGVQTENTSDTGGGLNVGWIDTDDWMDYSVNVTAAGSYTVSFRIASGAGGGTIQLRNSSGTTLCSATIGGTGGWQSWTTVTATANLSAGTQTLRLYASSGGYNINWVHFQAASNNLTISPTSISVGASTGSSTINVTSNVTWAVSDNQSWISTSTTSGSNNGSFTINVSANTGAARSGTVTVSGGGNNETISVSQTAASSGAAIPGIIQAESWTAMSGVQTENTSDTGGGLNVGWIDTGDWMDYSVNVASSGTYTVSFRLASGTSGGTIQLRNSSGNTLCSATVGGTGGWQNWTTVTATANLTAGSQTLRLYASSGGYNINWVDFVAGGSSSSTYYIKNRWQGSYLYDAGTNVGYASAPSGADYQWELIDIDGHQSIKNIGTGQYMNIENLNGSVQSTDIPTTYWSAQWAVEDYDGHKRIRNRWQSSAYIHVENLTGNAQYGTIDAAWHSGHWILESISGARITYENEESPLLEEIEESLLSVYPNPTDGNVSLTLDQNFSKALVQIVVMDVSGKIVSESIINTEDFASDSHQIKMDFLESGIYYIRLISDKNDRTFKIIKL